jgi:hypothetical protein
MTIQLIFGGMSLAVLVGMVGFQLLGRWFASHRPPKPEGTTGAGTAAIEASVFALLGLLVAFSFSGSETRLQARRELIVREADAVDTAYLRIDLLRDVDRPALKELFRHYLDARIAYYDEMLDLDSARAERARSAELQHHIWTTAVEATERTRDVRAAIVLLPAINEMFDVTTARDAALRMHIPLAIFLFLGVLSFACAFLVGMDMGRPERMSLLHVFLFAATMALTAYVILNIEFPRAGFVRMHHLDALLSDVRAGMT